MKLLLIIAVLLYACESHKILVVFPVPGKSHGILGAGVVKHLLNAGHEVTSILPFERKPHPNLTQILPDNSQFFNENFINIQKLMDKQMDMSDLTFIQQLMVGISVNTIQQDVVQDLIKDTSKTFDLVIVEWLFSELLAAFAPLYNCPLAWVSTVEPHWQVMRLIDEPMNPAYSTNILGTEVPPYSFKCRLEELWVQLKGYISTRKFNAMENEVYQEYIVPIMKQKGYRIPEYDDVIHNGSVMFGNSHFSMGLAPRLPQSYIPIGGYHIDVNVEPLKDDMKKILDNAENGLIYFSMGSNLKSKDIPDELKKGLLKVFSELKQTVLWKFEEVLPNLPKNVHIVSWAPQPSILAHPNTVLFISHGGLLSTTEAIKFGKPMIGIPVFADQFANVERAVHKGFARKVHLSYDMVEDIRREVKEVLGNPKFTQKAQEWSVVYHDRPLTPGQELIFWVDHVIKTRGALHLRSPALLLPWYQRMYLDLLVLILAALVVVVYGLKEFLCHNQFMKNKQKLS